MDVVEWRDKLWNDADYIKTVFRGNPTSSYTGDFVGSTLISSENNDS